MSDREIAREAIRACTPHLLNLVRLEMAIDKLCRDLKYLESPEMAAGPRLRLERDRFDASCPHTQSGSS